MKPIITMTGIEKDFKVPKKIERKTFFHKLKEVFYRENTTVKVRHNITCDIMPGEFVGYVGPNGAGKSTTIKILTGVLTPTRGKVSVAGYIPYKQRYQYTYNIGVVFGHRTLLEFDIPVIDSFLLYKDIYELSTAQFDERIKYFSKILKIDKLLHMPVRKLSLGERMRCEIAASLLHKPKVIFLDEPTIGLDALAKEEIRDFLIKINRDEGVTVVLTTHDMDDIEALCKRIIIIDQGKMIYDGALDALKKNYIKHKTIEVDFQVIKNTKMLKKVLSTVEILSKKNNSIKVRVNIKEHKIQNVINNLMKCGDISDLLVHEPRLEHIIKEIYETV